MKKLRIIIIIAMIVTAALILFLWLPGKRDKTLLTVEAVFMHYACGDGSDEMKVTKVDNPAYAYLLDDEIDPVTEEGKSDISGSLYSYQNKGSGLRLRLTGYLSNKRGGCDGTAHCFYVESIEILNRKK